MRQTPFSSRFKSLRTILRPQPFIVPVKPTYVGACSSTASPGAENACTAEATPPSTPFS